MTEKPYNNREEAKKQLITCGKWCTICESLSFLLVIIAIIWRVLKLDYLDLDSVFWLLLAIFFAVTSLAPHIHLALIKNQLGFDSENK